ncbi:MAG: ATP-binding protein [bacterium]|nr:ATP-binding protein [bacterium]
METKNNWYVITGGPCAGKTTLLEIMAERGYRVEFEMARIYIDEQVSLGKSLQEIRKNEGAFQREILRRKIELENKLPKDHLILFDRGIPDSIAYFELIGLSKEAEELRKIVRVVDYKKIFLLDLLEFKQDYARVEDKKTADKIQKLLGNTYRDLGFEVVKVPVPDSNKIEDRINFIIQNLE